MRSPCAHIISHTDLQLNRLQGASLTTVATHQKENYSANSFHDESVERSGDSSLAKRIRSKTKRISTSGSIMSSKGQEKKDGKTEKTFLCF